MVRVVSRRQSLPSLNAITFTCWPSAKWRCMKRLESINSQEAFLHISIRRGKLWRLQLLGLSLGIGYCSGQGLVLFVHRSTTKQLENYSNETTSYLITCLGGCPPRSIQTLKTQRSDSHLLLTVESLIRPNPKYAGEQVPVLPLGLRTTFPISQR